MNDEKILPAQIFIGYGQHKFLLHTSEVSAFLMNCNHIGFMSVNEITDEIEYMADIMLDGRIPDAAVINKHLRLLKALQFLVKGSIHPE